MPERPGGHRTAQQRDAPGVDAAAGNGGIDGAHRVVEIVTRKTRGQQITEHLAIAWRAADIHSQHRIAGGGQDVRLKGKLVAEHGSRLAGDFDDQRDLARRGPTLGGQTSQPWTVLPADWK